MLFRSVPPVLKGGWGESEQERERDRERERERETEGDREAGVCSVCIMHRDGERERQREIERQVCVVCVLCRDKIVVQGGTFMNNAVLRSFEKIIGRDVIRPDIAGLMGAYGCSLIAMEHSKPSQHSTILSPEQLPACVNFCQHQIGRASCRERVSSPV